MNVLLFFESRLKQHVSNLYFQLLVSLDTFYIVYDLVKRVLTTVAYVIIKTEEKIWFLTETAHVCELVLWERVSCCRTLQYRVS
jgi:hypothetical protein